MVSLLKSHRKVSGLMPFPSPNAKKKTDLPSLVVVSGPKIHHHVLVAEEEEEQDVAGVVPLAHDGGEVSLHAPVSLRSSACCFSHSALSSGVLFSGPISKAFFAFLGWGWRAAFRASFACRLASSWAAFALSRCFLAFFLALSSM